MDLDATYELIGVYTFGLINTFFLKNPELWFLVENSLYEDKEDKEILTSSAKAQEIP